MERLVGSGARKHALLEGGYISPDCETIFAVKGVCHPRGSVVAYPRYIKVGNNLHKIAKFQESMSVLMDRYKEFLGYDEYIGQVIPKIPISRIAWDADPIEDKEKVLREDNEMPRKAMQFMNLLKDFSSVSDGAIGLTGSLLLRTYRDGSDIDIVVYGVRECIAIYDALREMRCLRLTEKLTYKDLDTVIASRSDTSLDRRLWAFHESRKLLNGLFMGTVYTMKLVPYPEEYWDRYGERRYRSIGRATVKFIAEDCSHGIFTPCKYVIKVLSVLDGSIEAYNATSIVSYRSRFSEQLRDGEIGLVSGRLEYSDDGIYRIFIGNSIDDFLIVSKLESDQG